MSLIEITAIPNETAVTLTAETGAPVEMLFSPGGHRATFSRAGSRRTRSRVSRLPPGRPARTPLRRALRGSQ